MNEKPKRSPKPLTPKQLDRLKAGYKIGGGEIPPWEKAANKNTLYDLKRFAVYQILDALEKALKTGKHQTELKAIQELAQRAEIAQNYIANAPKRATKHRERVAALITELEVAISNLDNATGFDLYDKETW